MSDCRLLWASDFPISLLGRYTKYLLGFNLVMYGGNWVLYLKLMLLKLIMVNSLYYFLHELCNKWNKHWNIHCDISDCYSKRVTVVLTPVSNISATVISWGGQVIYFYNIVMMISSLFEINKISWIFIVDNRHVAPPRHIILTPSKSVFALTSKFCIHCGDVANTNLLSQVEKEWKPFVPKFNCTLHNLLNLAWNINKKGVIMGI